MRIKNIIARQILDSRGNPTVEADVILENGIMGRAIVPSGASTGINEAVELRDNDKTKYNGKGVLKAVKNVKTKIAKVIIGKDVAKQEEIDQLMISLDGTENKGKLGANSILAVSVAVAKAAAILQEKPLFKYFHEISKTKEKLILPVPQMNIINGGKHAAGSTDIQEFMIMPVGAENFSNALRMGAEIFHSLGKVLQEKGYQTTVGDEGGYAPCVKNGNKEALDLIESAVKKAGYKFGIDVLLALDVAASSLDEDLKHEYKLNTENKVLNSSEMVSWLSDLTKKYPIALIEDGLSENDWLGFKNLTKKIGNTTQIVGDDIFVTNLKFLKKGIKEKTANAILIKLNQIGTVTETIAAIEMARENKWNSVISHRSGETEDTTIAHFAVGLSTKQIKTGSLSRTDRIAKYNELLRIEEFLGDKAIYAGWQDFKK